MSKEERNKLKIGLYIMPFAVLFVSGVLYFMLSMSFGESYFFWGVCFMGTVFFGIILWTLRAIVLDLRDNEKKIIEGVITRKEKIVTTATRASGRRSRRTRTKRTYLFYFGDTKMQVQADLYNKFDEGDFVEIHMAKRVYSVIFKAEKIKSGQMMDVVAEQKAAAVDAKKGLNLNMGLLLLVLVPVVLTVFFTAVSDCFNCPNTYPESVTEWKPYRPKRNLSKPEEQKAEEIIAYLNDELLDEEEVRINEIFYQATLDGYAAEMVKYLHEKEIGDTRHALDWLIWKYDEQKHIDRSYSAVEIWKRAIYAIWPNEYFPPSHVYKQNNAKLADLHQIMMNNGGLDHEMAKAWFGKNNSKKEWQNITKELIPDEASSHTDGVNEFMKEVWSGPFLLEVIDSSYFEKAQKVYHIEKILLSI